MAADSLDFTFDTSFFDKGISRVMRGLHTMETSAASVARGVTRGFTRIIAVLGTVYGSFRLIRGAMNNIPEIGQVFGIARDIFTRNLLFPLRKEIIPLLQRLLDWVRDSRGAFVRWGNIIANVFRAVVAGVRNIIDFVRQMSIRVADFAARIFGDRIRDIEEIFNLITFKLAVVIQFVTLLLSTIGGLFRSFFDGLGDIGPTLRSILDSIGEFVSIFTTTNEEGDSFRNILSSITNLLGQMLDFVLQMTDRFLEGFVPAIEDIATPIQGIVDAFSDIFNSIFGSTEQMEKWGDLFESLGTFLGTTLMTTLEFIEKILTDIATAIETIQNLGFRGWIENMIETQRGVFGDIGSQGGIRWEDGRPQRVQDVILRPDGTMIETDPRDTLVALKDENTSFNNIERSINNVEGDKVFNVNVDFTGMNINLEQGSVEQGQQFAESLVEQVREAFNSEFERFGG